MFFFFFENTETCAQLSAGEQLGCHEIIGVSAAFRILSQHGTLLGNLVYLYDPQIRFPVSLKNMMTVKQ